MLNMPGVRRRPSSQSVLIQSQDAYRQCSKTCEVNRFCYGESYLCPLRTMWPRQTLVAARILQGGTHESATMHTTEFSHIAGQPSGGIGDLDSFNVLRRYDARWNNYPKSSVRPRVDFFRSLISLRTQRIPDLWSS